MRISDWSSDVCSSDLSVRWPSFPSRIGAMYQGISISADQPSASLLVACRQLPSQSLLNWLSLVTTASYTPSVELTVKRSEERRVGKECVSTCRFRWSPYH